MLRQWVGGRNVAVVVTISAAVLVVGPFAGRAHAATTAAVAGSDCAGSTDTLSWTAPAIAGVTGYHIVGENISFPDLIAAPTYDMGADQTSVQFPVELGTLEFDLYADTGQGDVAFDSIDIAGIQAPQPMYWDSNADGQNLVSNRSVTVAFGWSPETLAFESGNTSDRVTVTASPGGAAMTSSPLVAAGGGQSVTDTFSGLKNGVAYTFTSVASNACGTSGPAPSAPLTPSATGGITCTATGTAAQKTIHVSAPDGLSAINDVHSTNGTVTVGVLTPGMTAPVPVVVSKVGSHQPMTWSFQVADTDGHTRTCAG